MECQEDLLLELGITLNESQILNRDKTKFEDKYYQVFETKQRNKLKKGAKFKKPEENPSLRIEDVLFLNQLKEEKRVQSELIMQERKELEEKAAQMQKKLMDNKEEDSIGQRALKRSIPNDEDDS